MENSNPIFPSSSSSSSSPPNKYYDVFLSFRGEDTRKNFTGHLRDALRQKGFHTFFDDDKLDRGKLISGELLKAIADSDCSIVILSENYASSSWCLTELANIVKCMGTSGQILPLFYHVDPGHVRNQGGSYGEAFKKHEQDPKLNSTDVQSWRVALNIVGNLAGWHVTKDTTDESVFIREFIIQISRKLEVATLNISQDLFGMKSRLEKFEYRTISQSSGSVRFIGICGMGGIGKSTLARAYYNQNFYKFDGSSFLANIRETREKRGKSLMYLQTQLLSSILKDNNIKIDNVDRGIDMIRRRLRDKKVLIVLDDVNKLDQLKALAEYKDIEEENWFGSESIIIVTTKNQIVLSANGISAKYEAEILDPNEALQLFSQKAFKCSNPPPDYKKMCEKVIEYARGLPLALEVLGSLLHGKKDFEKTLGRLKEDQNEEINSVLKVSFDDLGEIDQNIFLYIACFFNKYNKDHVIEILDSCGVSNAEHGIDNLIEKCLLSIDQHSELNMHDLLQDMGKKIVRKKSHNEPGKQSRIWDVTDFYKIVEDETETEKVEAIVTSVERSKKLTTFQAISRMKNLRLLMISDPDFLCGNDSLTPDLEYLSNKLRLLQWDTFPYKDFPSSFRPYSLVKLKLFDSRIEKLWKKHATPLGNLKIIDLSNSWNLTKFEDFTVVPNLERLILEGCINLWMIHDSITSLEKLILLNLASCTSFKKLPKSIKGMKSLQILNLYNCCELCELPVDFGRLKSLKEVDVRDSGIRRLRSSIFLIENLKVLCDEEVAESSLRERIINPPIGHCFLPDNFQTLKKLELSDCNLMDEAFPEHFGKLISLEELNLSKNPFSVLPPLIKGLSKLTYLSLMYCKFLRHLSPDQLPSSLETLRVDYCTSLNTLLDDPLEPCHFQCSTYCVDCIELVKRRGGEMIALASLKRYIQKPNQPTRPFDIVIPGSKIPDWFLGQSPGPSIIIKLGGNKRWIGIAFFLCFRANSSDDEFSCVVKFRGINKKWNVVTKRIYRRSSSHFWLSYSPRDFYLECLQNGCYGLEFSFYANGSNNSCCGPCGVRLVYEEDIEELNRIILKNCNTSPENEAGEHYSLSKRGDLELMGRNDNKSPEDQDGQKSKNIKGIFGSILVATIVASLVVALRHKSH